MTETSVVAITEDLLMQRDSRELAVVSIALQRGFDTSCRAMLKRAIVEIDNGELNIGISANVILEALNHEEHDDCDVYSEMVSEVSKRLLVGRGMH